MRQDLYRTIARVNDESRPIAITTSKGKGATFAEPKHDHSSQPKEEQWLEAIAASEKELEAAKNA